MQQRESVSPSLQLLHGTLNFSPTLLLILGSPLHATESKSVSFTQNSEFTLDLKVLNEEKEWT